MNEKQYETVNSKEEKKNEQKVQKGEIDLEREEQKESNEKSEEKGEEKKEITISKKEYNNLKEKSQQLEDQKQRVLRISAEYENAKKRLRKEKEDFVKFANEKLVSKLLNILDDFQRALDSAEQGHDLENVVEGVKMIKNQFFSVLKDSGLEKIKAKGEKFNPNVHEAIDFTETDEYKEDIVTEVFQPGYLFKGRLIRPSVVKIAKSPKKEKEREKEKEEQASEKKDINEEDNN